MEVSINCQDAQLHNEIKYKQQIGKGSNLLAQRLYLLSPRTVYPPCYKIL